MNYIKIFPYFIGTFILFACNKYDESQDDFSGQGYIGGKLLLSDTIFGTVNLKATSSASVKIQYANEGSGLNFLYSVKTNSDGYFVFSNLKTGIYYRIFYSDSIDGKFYKADTTVLIKYKFGDQNSYQDSLTLLGFASLDYKKGLFISVKDKNGQPLPKTKVCVFNNAQLFSGVGCEGSILSKEVESNGKVLFENILPGKYYIRVIGNIGTEEFAKDTSIQLTDALPLWNGTVVINDLSLKTNYIEFVTVDENRQILPNTKVCLFTNSSLVKVDSCTGSIQSKISDSVTGKVKFNGLSLMKYYAYAKVVYGDSIYNGNISLDLLLKNPIRDTIFLKK